MDHPIREIAERALRALIAHGYDKNPATDYIINDQLKCHDLAPLPPEGSTTGDWLDAAAIIWSNLTTCAEVSFEEAEYYRSCDPAPAKQLHDEANVCCDALAVMQQAGYKNGYHY